MPLLSPLSDRSLNFFKSASTRGHLCQSDAVSDSVMKNMYAITFHQIPRFNYNFCPK